METSEIALIQGITPRHVKQLWLANKLMGLILLLKITSRLKSEVISDLDFATVVKVCDELNINALSLEFFLR
jgi:hypothetical protein